VATLTRDAFKIVAQGTYKRPSLMLALIATAKLLPIEWAGEVLSIGFPPNVERGIWGVTHPDFGGSVNNAIQYTRVLPKAPDAVFLLEAPKHIAFGIWERWMKEPDDVVGVVSPDHKALIVRPGMLKDLPFKDGKLTAALKEVSWLDLDAEGEEEPPPLSGLKPPTNPEHTIVVAVPTLGYVSLAFILHFFQMAFPVASIREMAIVKGLEVAEARERCIDHLLSLDPLPSYFVFLGDDMLSPPVGMPMLFDTLLDHKLETAAGLYHMKMPYPQPLMWKTGHIGLLRPGRDFKHGDLVECDGTGLDYCLFRSELFKKISKPRFKTGHELVAPRQYLVHTEDAWFWQKCAEETGVKPRVDTRVTIGHFDYVTGRVF